MIRRRAGSRYVVLICGLWFAGCGEPGDGLDVYRVTNTHAGHEFVKTEQFLVPVGSVVSIQFLDFAPGVSTLSPTQELIVQQVFNSLEEITENTVNDTNTARVAEYTKMEFEVRGFPDPPPPSLRRASPGGSQSDTALGEARSKTVIDLLTNLGTPAWRLKAKGMPADPQRNSSVVFVRTR